MKKLSSRKIQTKLSVSFKQLAIVKRMVGQHKAI